MEAIGRRRFLGQAAVGIAALSAKPVGGQDDPKALEHTLAVVSGTARERGRQYGRQFKDGIRGFLDREIYRAFDGQPNTRETMLRFSSACGAAIKTYSAEVHEEMEGIAEGAGLRLEEVVLINNHEELWHRGVIPAQAHCTVFGSAPPDTAAGETFVAQTWDWMESVYGLSSLLHWKRDKGPSVLAYSYPGLWTGAGINDRGLSLCWHSGGGDGKEPRVGIPAYALIAQILYQETLEAALEEVRRATHAGWFVFLVGDAKGGLATVRGTPKKLEIQTGAKANGGYVAAKGDARVDLARMQAQCVRVKVGSTIDAMIFNNAAKEIHVTRRAGGVTPWKRFAL